MHGAHGNTSANQINRTYNAKKIYALGRQSIDCEQQHHLHGLQEHFVT